MREARAFSSLLLLAILGGCEFVGDANGVPACTGVPQCDATGKNPDLLHTCSIIHDAYDCEILAFTAAAGEPDAMLFKAQISLESNFDPVIVSPDIPCKSQCDTLMAQDGWTEDECRSFGLLQLTPACGWLKDARLPNGHPNMTLDTTSPDWATSVFNPDVNIPEGIRAIVVNRAQVTHAFPGCSEVEYTKMALAGFNRGSGSVTGCNQMNAMAAGYVSTVLNRYSDLAKIAGWPDRYQ